MMQTQSPAEKHNMTNNLHLLVLGSVGLWKLPNYSRQKVHNMKSNEVKIQQNVLHFFTKTTLNI